MYLHDDKELFRDVVEMTSERIGVASAVVEKDYYVTMILKKLSKKDKNIVLRAGHLFRNVFI